jgi:hypothetical protein
MTTENLDKLEKVILGLCICFTLLFIALFLYSSTHPYIPLETKYAPQSSSPIEPLTGLFFSSTEATDNDPCAVIAKNTPVSEYHPILRQIGISTTPATLFEQYTPTLLERRYAVCFHRFKSENETNYMQFNALQQICNSSNYLLHSKYSIFRLQGKFTPLILNAIKYDICQQSLSNIEYGRTSITPWKDLLSTTPRISAIRSGILVLVSLVRTKNKIPIFLFWLFFGDYFFFSLHYFNKVLMFMSVVSDLRVIHIKSWLNQYEEWLVALHGFMSPMSPVQG